MSNLNIAIFGASGGIGSAFIKLYAQNGNNNIFAFSRTSTKHQLPKVVYSTVDYSDEKSIQVASEILEENQAFDVVIVATGFLHDQYRMPEKSLRDLSAEKFEKNFLINSIGPALVAKYFLPRLPKNQRAIFAALSARVGSISDNQLGGWYAYRASKAALNMLIKTASIEVGRRNKHAIVVALHPGTVATNLSEPFQKNVAQEKLFSPAQSTKSLYSVLNKLSIEDTGKIFAWDGKEIPY